MTKQRHCFVTQVGDAIEALASALDPERKPPFSGDILDLLEWAEKDVRAMRSEIERLKTVPMRYRRMAFNAQLQDENAQLSQQLAEYKGSYENACNLVARMHAAAVGEVTGPRRGVVEDVEDLRQQLTDSQRQVTLLRDALYKYSNGASGALAATEPPISDSGILDGSNRKDWHANANVCGLPHGKD